MTVRNHPQFHKNTGSRIMAVLLLGAAWTTSLSACLIPQDDQVIPELPPRRNSPIKIVDYQPAKLFNEFPPSSCGTVRPNFSVTVTDSDPGDQVRSLWFIDIDIDLANAVGFEPRALSLAPGRVQVTPPTSGPFVGRLRDLPTGTHTLTVFVSDSAFDVTGGIDGKNIDVTAFREPVTLADGGLVDDSPSIDSFTWTLAVRCP